MTASPPVQPNLQFARTLPGDDIVNPVFSDVTVSNEPTTQSFDGERVQFIGTYSPKTLTGGDSSNLYLSGRKLPAKPVAEIAFSLENIWQFHLFLVPLQHDFKY